MSFGRVAPDWDPGEPVYVIGGGPSLAPYVDRLPELCTRGRVVGVNRAAELVGPELVDATFSLDRVFAEEYEARLRSWAFPAEPSHEVYLAVPDEWFERHRAVPGVTYLRRRPAPGVSTDPKMIANGLHSGYGALNLAVLKGAKTIYLLGFDLHREGPTHWHDGYPWSNGSSRTYFDRWAKRFEAAARDRAGLGVRVVNANPRSAVRCFEFSTYEEVLGR